MAQEDSTDTPAPAEPPATATLSQKTREGETRFAFHAARLDYTFAGRQGTRIERRIPWNVVPPLSRLRRNARPDARANAVIRLTLIALILFVAARLAIPVSPLLLAFGFAGLLWGLTILLSRRFRLRNAVLSTREGNIVVLGDAAEETVLARLMESRRAYYRRLAAIDNNRSVRWNLQRLRWMFEQEVIGRDDFVQAQRALLPAVPEPLLRALPKPGPDLQVEQRFVNALFAFDFRSDRLHYRRRTSLGIEQAMTVKYLDLPEPTDAVRIGAPSELLPQVTLWLVLIGFGYALEMIGHLPGWYFAGADGLERGLVVFGPGLAVVLLGILAARRALRLVCTKLANDIFILHDRQHDAILAELKRRRLEALKAMAEPDPLLSPAEQANVLAGLRERGIIDAQESTTRIARAAALQKHLGLADPEPGADAAMPDEARAPQSPPRPTIH